MVHCTLLGWLPGLGVREAEESLRGETNWRFRVGEVLVGGGRGEVNVRMVQLLIRAHQPVLWVMMPHPLGTQHLEHLAG
ncbi:hypothetical protein D3C76_1374970 [compost metagenome]